MVNGGEGRGKVNRGEGRDKANGGESCVQRNLWNLLEKGLGGKNLENYTLFVYEFYMQSQIHTCNISTAKRNLNNKEKDKRIPFLRRTEQAHSSLFFAII